MRFLPKDISDFFLETIRETVDYRLENNIQRNDVMDLLLKLKDNGTKEEGKITFNELAAQCKVFNNFLIISSSNVRCFSQVSSGLLQVS